MGSALEGFVCSEAIDFDVLIYVVFLPDGTKKKRTVRELERASPEEEREEPRCLNVS